MTVALCLTAFDRPELLEQALAKPALSTGEAGTEEAQPVELVGKETVSAEAVLGR